MFLCGIYVFQYVFLFATFATQVCFKTTLQRTWHRNGSLSSCHTTQEVRVESNTVESDQLNRDLQVIDLCAQKLLVRCQEPLVASLVPSN